MQLSDVNNLFNGKTTLPVFKKLIESEVSDYKQLLKKKGSSVPVLLNEDLSGLILRVHDIKLLCSGFLLGEFDKWELNYVVEGLLLSEKVSCDSHKVRDALSALTDPEYFQSVNAEYVEEVLEGLDG